MKTRLRLFLDWGITFEEPYQTPDRGQRRVYYADRKELEENIRKKYPDVELPPYLRPKSALSGRLAKGGATK